jgi:hypothetical protein
MEAESDRGCLLVGLSQISDLLGEALLLALSGEGASVDANWLLDPKPGARPLANLAIRTRMARCLELINEEHRRVIDAMRKLRNEHAHGTGPFVLSDEAVSPIVEAWSFWYEVVLMAPDADIWPTPQSVARRRLDFSVIMVAEHICHAIQCLKEGRRPDHIDLADLGPKRTQ